MYWDLIVLGILIVAVIFFFRDFDSFVYLIASIDILLRILDYIKLHLGVPEISSLIGRYLPSSVPSLIHKYTTGMVADILMWCYVVLFVIFLFYTLRILWKKR